jgi:hypothetical protein
MATLFFPCTIISLAAMKSKKVVLRRLLLATTASCPNCKLSALQLHCKKLAKYPRLPGQRRPQRNSAAQVEKIERSILGPIARLSPSVALSLIAGKVRQSLRCGSDSSDTSSPTAANDSSTTSSTSAFVSTNDMITSWFMSQSCFRYGFMAVNVRGRLDTSRITRAII